MFVKIPQRFTAPFGLLSDEAKLAFRSQPGGISKLATVRHISEIDSYWNQYIELFDSASDVFSLITPHDIRRGLIDAPENIATLIRVITSRLFNLVSDHTFPSSTNTSVTAFASSFIMAGAGSAERNTTREVLNCIRILQRVLPIVFEIEGESNIFELEVLWKKQEVKEDQNTETATEIAQFVIDDEDDSEDWEEKSNKSTSHKHTEVKKKRTLPSLGEKLFSCIIDILFCCGFTLPTKMQVDHHKIHYTIWEKGIGSTSDPSPSHTYDSNKTEVLRLLLVLLSRQIYIPSASLFTRPSLYTLHLVQRTPRRDVLTILCSLLNTAMNSSLSNISIIGGMAGKLPYNHLVFKGEDSRSTLVGLCFQVLCVLLDFQSGPARDKATGGGDNQSAVPTAHTNAFRYFLARLHRTQDFAFIVGGIVGILEQQIATVNNLLPGARKSIPHIVETVIFFWKMIELNKKFRAYVLESEKSMDILAYLLCYGMDIKDKPQQYGLCRVLSYIIQTLSSEPAFGLKLSNPILVQIPPKWNTPGTAADFLINSIYAIVATTSGVLGSIYPALIIALSNSAPYFKNLTATSSTRLIQLFSSFSNPLFLLADEGHPRLLFFMLEIFNSVMLNNMTENRNLIYAILAAHKSFEDMATFTLSRGLREIRRVQSAKEEQARKTEGNHKGKSMESKEEEPHLEKIRLLGSGSGDLEVGEPVYNSIASQQELAGQDNQTPALEILSTEPHSDVSLMAEGLPSEASEKAKGKMRARRSMSVDTTGSLDRISAARVGRNGFVPSQEWVTSWQQGLPLDSVMLLISELLPKIQELQASRHKPSTISAIMDFLGMVTLKRVLPPTLALTPRRFMWSEASIIWLTSLIWGEIYVRGMTPLGIWNSTNVRLFYVKHAQVQQRQISDTVSSVVGGFLGRNSDASPSPRRDRA